MKTSNKKRKGYSAWIDATTHRQLVIIGREEDRKKTAIIRRLVAAEFERLGLVVPAGKEE